MALVKDLQYFSILLLFITFLPISTHGDRLEEVSVAVSLLGMDLEDCISKAARADLEILLEEKNARSNKVLVEKQFGSFAKEQANFIREYSQIKGLEVSEMLQRQWDIVTKMGDTELPEDSWSELVTFKNSNDQLSQELKVPCFNKSDSCTISKKDIQKILKTSRDAKELQDAWSASQKVFTETSEKYSEILKLASEAAKVNGFEDVSSYWEMLVEYPDAYSTAKTIWDEIEPFYIKFHEFVKSRLAQYYTEIKDSTSIPVYLLGSEFGTDWSDIAPLVLPHRYLYDEIVSMLEFENIGGQKVYEIAEKFTNSMGFGKAGKYFWNNSRFNNTCPSHLLDFCAEKYSAVVTCNTTGWTQYLDAHEDMVRVTLNKMDYPALAFNNFRISALDEALVSLSSVLALKNLPVAGIVPKEVFFEQPDDRHQMTALFLSALRILPRLPYYLIADTWRLNQLQESGNVAVNISSWWQQRESIQRVKGVTNEEWDFLGDSYMNFNKPYIGKFLGTVLQFQILEYFQNEVKDGVNVLTHMSEDENFKTMLKQRSEHDWPRALSDNLYYDVASDALLEYFRPLEEYMENAPVQQVTQTVRPKTTTTTTPLPPPTTTTDIALTKDEPWSGNTSSEVVKQPALAKLQPIIVAPVAKAAPTPRPRPVAEAEDETPASSASATAAWIGALIGVGSMTVIVAIVMRRRCRRKPVTNNRRHDV